MAGEYTDVHIVVNDLAKQVTGREDIKVVDTASFMDFGRAVLGSSDMLEGFLNALSLKYADTYYTARRRVGKLKSLLVSGKEWAAIYQKIDGEVPDFVEDETFKLEEGKSVDQYVVRKPKSTQKLFVRKVTYSNFLTWQKKLLQGAFMSEQDFRQFASMLSTKMYNKLDMSTENLGRMAMASYIANMKDSQKVHLLTKYNELAGTTLTKGKALLDRNFTAWATGQVELYTKRMGDHSIKFNAEGAERFTPIGDNRLVVLDEFQNSIAHTVQYDAFHREMVELRQFEEVSYWQNQNDNMSIKVTTPSETGEEPVTTTVNNIVAFAFDRYALGSKRVNTEVLTTPMNARGRYANTFYHNDSLWFNDLSENGIVFLLD